MVLKNLKPIACTEFNINPAFDLFVLSPATNTYSFTKQTNTPSNAHKRQFEIMSQEHSEEINRSKKQSK